MKLVKELAYSPVHERCKGDLYLPDTLNDDTLPVLLIHGGGWTNMDKSRFHGIASWLCENGFAVFNVNYRLLGMAPWPACGDDCLAAAAFLLHGDVPELVGVKRNRIGVMGGSAGGHLALMTGLRFPATKWVVSVSGIADPVPFFRGQFDYLQSFFGGQPSLANLISAFPEHYLDPAQTPPVLCTHMRGDEVVPIESVDNFERTAALKGVTLSRFTYDPKAGYTGHGIWRPDAPGTRFVPELEAAILDFVNTKGNTAL